MTKPRLRYDPNNDFYTVLGVQPSAAIPEISRAYRQRAKEVHPDLNRERSTWAHEQFQRVRDAYDTLTDPGLRSEYDERRLAYLQPVPTLGASRPTSYQEASRAAWSRRNKRRQPAYIFLVPLVLTILSCWMLKFSQPDNSGLGGNNGNSQIFVPPQNTANSVLVATGPAVALNTCNNPDVMISQPIDGASVHVPFRIMGTVSSKDFASYSVQIGYYAPRRGGMRWLALRPEVTQPAESGTLLSPTDTLNLANWHGDYTLRVVVQLSDGNSVSSCDIAVHLNAIAADFSALPSAR